MRKRIISIVLTALMLLSMIPIMAVPASAMTYSEYQSKYNAFINDSRWCNGTAWGSSQQPKQLGTAWYGCAAYAVDFCYYVYGYSNPRSGSKWSGDANNIQRGDIVHFTYKYKGNSNQHWIVVLERNENSLYVAEGSYSSKVRISNGSYYISNSKLCSSAIDSGTSVITEAFHYDIVDDPVTPKTTFDVNVNLDGTVYGNGVSGITFDVYINGNLVADDAGDHYNFYPVGATYLINDIKYPNGYSYAGNAEISGTVGSEGVYLNLDFKSNYTDTIYLWAWGFKNGEGNNGGENTAFFLGNSSFTKYAGEHFHLTAGYCNVAIPNGYYLGDGFGSDYSGAWADYIFGDEFIQPSGNVIIQYNCIPYNYSITYNLNGGINSPNNPSNYNVLYGVTFDNPTREGYVFTGWTDENGNAITGINPGANANYSFAEELYSSLKNRTTGNKTVYANWEPISSYKTNETVFNGHKYELYSANLTWLEAKANAESLGGHLVTVTSAEEQNAVVGLDNNEIEANYWLGGTDENIEGQWEWITGEEWDYDNWLGGQPDNYTLVDPSGENYLMIYFGKYDHKWNDSTYYADGFIVEYESFVCDNNGHTFGEWSVTTEPTCTETGIKERVCSVCGTVEEDTVPALGHDWSAWYDHPINNSKEIRYCLRCEATETRDKEIVIPDGIKIEKLTGYDIRLTGLDPALSYTIRYATGEYTSASDVKKGENAGFMQVSGVAETTISLPTHGLHTVCVIVGSEQKFIGTVTIEQSDIENQFKASTSDLTVTVENLYGANRVNLIRNGSIVMKVNSNTFQSNGLKTWAEFNAPAPGEYTVRILYADGATVEGMISVTVPAASVSTNGRVFALADYGANNVTYIRLAKGVITTTAEMKTASDLRTYGRKYFTGETAAFAALDAINGETTTYTVQIGYASGYTEFVTFEITPTVPVITTTSDSIILSNVQTDSYYLDWIRCAPGVQTSLYGVRHAKGSQVKKTTDIEDEMIIFSDLTPGTYTLYYLYDGWNLSEGMVTVTVG